MKKIIELHKLLEPTTYWLVNNKLHREDGPAAIYCNGVKVWYINGARIKTVKPDED